MDSLSTTRLAVRHISDSANVTPLTFDLLLTLLVLVLVSLLSATALLILRRRRRSSKEASLPFYNDSTLTAGRSHHRRTPSSLSAPLYSTRPPFNSNFYGQEKYGMASDPSSPPRYPLPEIRIHFPEETDETGKKQSARIVAVRVGENGIGLEPIEENLPPYQKDANDRFQSLDMNRLGGLKEKDVMP